MIAAETTSIGSIVGTGFAIALVILTVLATLVSLSNLYFWYRKRQAEIRYMEEVTNDTISRNCMEIVDLPRNFYWPWHQR